MGYTGEDKARWETITSLIGNPGWEALCEEMEIWIAANDKLLGLFDGDTVEAVGMKTITLGAASNAHRRVMNKPQEAVKSLRNINEMEGRQK